MVRRLGKCSLCDFSITKNGEWNLDSEMRKHLREEHPEEFKAWERKMQSINDQIYELKRQRVRLYTSHW